jgi:hypothetical protein
MSRFSPRFLVFVLTFAIGVSSVVIWNQSPTPQEDSPVPLLPQPTFPKEESLLPQDSARFRGAGVQDDKEVIEFYLKFQNAVSRNDKRTVASMMIYPLRVNFPTDADTKDYTFVKDRASFLRVYDRIFDGNVKRFIEGIDVENSESIWARYDGIAVGRGTIWIGVFCSDKPCESDKYHINIRTIHGNNHLDLD